MTDLSVSKASLGAITVLDSGIWLHNGNVTRVGVKIGYQKRCDEELPISARLYIYGRYYAYMSICRWTLKMDRHSIQSVLYFNPEIHCTTFMFRGTRFSPKFKQRVYPLSYKRGLTQ